MSSFLSGRERLGWGSLTSKLSPSIKKGACAPSMSNQEKCPFDSLSTTGRTKLWPSLPSDPISPLHCIACCMSRRASNNATHHVGRQENQGTGKWKNRQMR